jgi:hypothetical protein
MNTDRSKSLYVISWVHDLGPVSESELAIALQSKFGAYDSAYIHQRLFEQKSRGVFEFRNNKFTLTKLGNIYWSAANLLSSIFNLTGWQNAKINSGDI